MSNGRRFTPRRGLIVPDRVARLRAGSPDLGPRSQSPEITKLGLPTLNVTCPRPAEGPDACTDSGKNLEIRGERAISPTRIRRGYHCPGCGYETDMEMELPAGLPR